MAGNVPWDVLDDIDYGDNKTLASVDRDEAIIEDVKCVHETPRALICLFKGMEVKRPVPKSHVLRHSPIQKQGDEGQLIVSRWLGRKLNTELEDGGMTERIKELAEEKCVTVEKVVCLREGAKAILVQLEDGREMWIPKSHIKPGGDVENDGDMGKLRVSAWLAKTKGLTEETP